MPRLLTAGWQLERFQATDASISAADLRSLLAADPRGRSLEDHRSLCRARIQGPRPRCQSLRSPCGQGLEVGRSPRRSCVAGRWLWSPTLAGPLRLGPGRADRPAGLAGRSRRSNLMPARSESTRWRPSPSDWAAMRSRVSSIASTAELQQGPLSLLATARIRDQIADLGDRAAWLADESTRRHLLERTRQLLERLG